MRGLARVAAVLSVVVSGACAATIETGSFADRDVNFTRYRTFRWGPASQQTGDARIAKDPAFQDHLQGEVERQLQAKGLLLAAGGRPDLLIRSRAAIGSRVEVARTPDAYGYCGFDCPDRIREYDTATLVIDLVDARTRRIVWRGWARDDLGAVVGHPDRMTRTIRDAVTGMLERFPPAAAMKGA